MPSTFYLMRPLFLKQEVHSSKEKVPFRGFRGSAFKTDKIIEMLFKKK